MPKTAVVEPEQDTRGQTRLAPRWKVILHNDDITTFAFVTALLKSLFHKPQAEAVRLANEAHTTGSALITVVSFERAELYVEQVRSLARPQGFPLTATIEPAD